MALRNTNYRHTSYKFEIGDEDYGQFITNVNYTKTREFEWVTPLGSDLPVNRNEGNLVSEGSVTLLTDGLDKLNAYAVSQGFLDFTELPLLDITITHTTFDNELITIYLNKCKFLTYGLNVQKGTLIMETECPMAIHSIVVGS